VTPAPIRARAPLRRVEARQLAQAQREISISEFFVKNRHLLGFDSPARALLTAVKEAVDNALDACEEAGFLPEITVEIEPKGDAVFRIAVEDNGPGIVESQIGKVFGKLLYGSKFHALRQSRGQQGMGISAAGMYGQLTTGEPMRVLTRTSRRAPARELVLSIDTAKNRPQIHRRGRADWDVAHGTRVELEIEGHHQRGQHSVAEYIRQTALANPHATIRFEDADGERTVYPRTVRSRPLRPRRIAPHPHGVELGTLIAMLAQTRRRTLGGFLAHEFSRIGAITAKTIVDTARAGLLARTPPHTVSREQARALHGAMSRAKVSAPPTDCVVPIGEALVRRSLRAMVDAEFYTALMRPPAVYRGYPFQVEVGLAYGRPEAPLATSGRERLAADQPVRLFRLANRVPLLFQPGACAITQAVVDTNWHHYGLQQGKDALPIGPVAILVHVASVWVPFTSEAKEAIAAYPEIEHELRLALQECGRRLAHHLAGIHRISDREQRRARIARYVPHITAALARILDLDEARRTGLAARLETTLDAEGDDAPWKNHVDTLSS